MKAKRSLTSSFDNLLKRKASKDDLVPIPQFQIQKVSDFYYKFSVKYILIHICLHEGKIFKLFPKNYICLGQSTPRNKRNI